MKCWNGLWHASQKEYKAGEFFNRKGMMSSWKCPRNDSPDSSHLIYVWLWWAWNRIERRFIRFRRTRTLRLSLDLKLLNQYPWRKKNRHLNSQLDKRSKTSSAISTFLTILARNEKSEESLLNVFFSDFFTLNWIGVINHISCCCWICCLLLSSHHSL